MKKFLLAIALSVFIFQSIEACSVIYYRDTVSGSIYVVNNEDYWLDTETYLQIQPRKKGEYARIWYGWDDFAQGGINEKGLFFDAATTPEQVRIRGFSNPKSNLGDQLLAQCATVEEAIEFLQRKKIALTNSHLMFGDKSGEAVIIEWVDGKQELIWIKSDRLIMTNFLLANPGAGNSPCYRYQAITSSLDTALKESAALTLGSLGNLMARVAQLPTETAKGRMVGTLYTSFINITNNEFYLSFKLNTSHVLKLDLTTVFEERKRRRITLR